MSEVTDSILLSVKKLNNVPRDYMAFDDDFVMYINAAFSDLNQLGIGPEDGFSIEDENDRWDDFINDGPILNRVKSYVARHVRIQFDPPNNSFGIQMMKEQLEEQGWRLKAAQEDEERESVVDL